MTRRMLMALAFAMMMPGGCAAPQQPTMAVTALVVKKPGNEEFRHPYAAAAALAGASEAGGVQSPPVVLDDEIVMVTVVVRRADGSVMFSPRIFTRIGEVAEWSVTGGTESIELSVEPQHDPGGVAITTIATVGGGTALRDRLVVQR